MVGDDPLVERLLLQASGSVAPKNLSTLSEDVAVVADAEEALQADPDVIKKHSREYSWQALSGAVSNRSSSASDYRRSNSDHDVGALERAEHVQEYAGILLQIGLSSLCFIYIVGQQVWGPIMTKESFTNHCVHPDSKMPFEMMFASTVCSSLLLLVLQGPTNQPKPGDAGSRPWQWLLLDWCMLLLLVSGCCSVLYHTVEASLKTRTPLCGLAVISTSSIPVKCFQIMALEMLISKTIKWEALHQHQNRSICKSADPQNIQMWTNNMRGVLKHLKMETITARMSAMAKSWPARMYQRISYTLVFIFFYGKSYYLGVLLLVALPTQIMYLPLAFVLAFVIWRFFARWLESIAVKLMEKGRRDRSGSDASHQGYYDPGSGKWRDDAEVESIEMKRVVLRKLHVKGKMDWVSGKMLAAPVKDKRLVNLQAKIVEKRYEEELEVFRVCRTPRLAYRYYYAFPLFAGLAVPMFSLMTLRLSLNVATNIEQALENGGSLTFLGRVLIFWQSYCEAFLETMTERSTLVYFTSYSDIGFKILSTFNTAM